jgi:hypothetical protein
MTSIGVVLGLRRDHRPTVALNVLSGANHSNVSEVAFINVFGSIQDRSLFETVVLGYDSSRFETCPLQNSW